MDEAEKEDEVRRKDDKDDKEREEVEVEEENNEGEEAARLKQACIDAVSVCLMVVRLL